MRWAPFATLASLLVAAPSALAAWGMPDPITDRLQIIQDIYIQLLVVGTLVFLFVFAWLVYNLVKFRPGGEGEPTFEEERSNIKAEIAWTVVPIIIVAWVGVISYDGFQALEQEPEDPAAEIQLEGFQWFWQANYGEDVELSQQPGSDGSLANAEPFLIPAGEPVTFNVTSGDVIHSFWIPELGVKIDATPGRSNTVSVTAPEGEYLIQCAEFCGRAHAYMRAKVHAVPQDEYDGWLSQKQQAAAKSGLRQEVTVNLTSEGIEPDPISTVGNVTSVFNINNQADSARTFSIDGLDNGTTDEIPAGESATLEVTLEAGDYTVSSGGQMADLTAREAEAVEITLDEWSVETDTPGLQAGQPYLIRVVNEGKNLHNVFLGDPEEKEGSDAVFVQTDNLDPGESTTILYEPTADQTGTHTLWCDIAGHYSQGMHTEFDISG